MFKISLQDFIKVIQKHVNLQQQNCTAFTMFLEGNIAGLANLF